MEEFAEVSTEQEFQSAEAQEMPSPHGEDHDARGAHDDPSSAGIERSPASEVTDEVLPNEAEPTVEETKPMETGAEDSAADFDGNEVPEEGPPEIDPAVYAGWQELAKAHPEVVGKPLPDDIMKACVESGLPPLRVYESMMLKKQGEQIAALQQEIATLRQNAEAAQRAPVTAASLGGSEGNDPDDEFLRGFNS